MDADKIAFQGEVMLLQWAESSTRGRTVTLLLGDEGESHPFRDFTIRQGKRAGQRFMAVLVQIGDDEQPVEHPKTLSQQAFMLCRDPEFYTWASARCFDSVVDEPSARNYICSMLGIGSRSQLDTNPAAADGFRRLVLAPFNAHRSAVSPTL